MDDPHDPTPIDEWLRPRQRDLVRSSFAEVKPMAAAAGPGGS